MMDNTAPFLKPIERPEGLSMKLIYYFTKKQLGKVITPVKVFTARMPLAFGKFSGKMYQLDKLLALPPELVLLLRQKIAQINVCEFCMDAGRAKAIKDRWDERKFNALHDYNASPLFTEAEKAALDYVTEVTSRKSVRPETFQRLASFYTERAICEIVHVLATEHVSNIVNISLNIHSDMLCDLQGRR